MTFPKDLVAASATPIILAVLQGRDTYGYAIIRKVQQISDHRIDWKEGMLYPVLHRLEAAGLVESYWVVAENGRRRKYYHITVAGRSEYRALIDQWSVVYRALCSLSEESP